MNIYVDESGSFVNAPRPGSWNVVVAYASPEGDKRKLRECLRRLKLASGHRFRDEIKLGGIDESLYLQFLYSLGKLAGVVFCTATDAGWNNDYTVSEHQRQQVKLALSNIDRMRHRGGRDGVRLLASQLGELPSQLYVQLHCQIDLFFDVVSRVAIYFIQRRPNSLKRFRWRIDQKNSTKTDYEDAFEKLSPLIIQTRSLTRPVIFVNEFDYRPMKEFMFEDGEAPEYLKRDYGIRADVGLDVGKIIRGDIEFVDSRESNGVQVADLVASGIRRCMRRGFADNIEVARALGSCMIQAEDNKPPLNLIGFSQMAPIEGETAELIQIMIYAARPMISSRPGLISSR